MFGADVAHKTEQMADAMHEIDDENFEWGDGANKNKTDLMNIKVDHHGTDGLGIMVWTVH